MARRRQGVLGRQLDLLEVQGEPTEQLASGLRVTRVHSALGAKVEGIDLKQPISPDMARELTKIWANQGNGIMIFPRQKLTEAELRDFAKNFGTVMPHPFNNNNNADFVKNNGDLRGGVDEVITIKDRADTWHTDMTWMKNPPRATFLQCVERGPEMASGGFEGGPRGSTMVCSMTNTYDMLSPGLQKMLEGMTCRHSVTDLMLRSGEDPEKTKEYPNGLITSPTENEHPAIIVHPVSGRKSMYVNNWPCKRFTGMSQEETAPLKRYLNTVATQEKNVYKHDWQEGDLMCIDQRVTMHYVFPDYDPGKMKRVMQRTMIADQGEAPGSWGQPRPKGVSGLTGPEMSTVEDCGGTPTSYSSNVTMLPGSYTPQGAQPFSDRFWDGGVRRTNYTQGLDPEQQQAR